MARSYESDGVIHLLSAQDLVTTTAASKILDTAGFRSAELLVNIGTVGSVSGSNYVTPTLQESATTTGTDFTDVAAGDIASSTFAAVNSSGKQNATYYASYKGSKRYLRVNLVITGTTASCLAAVTGLLTGGRHLPVAAPAAITAS